MKSIELDRRFVPWEKDSSPGADQWSQVYAKFHLKWGDLHQRRRVVVLAEAGSGKTTELMRQADNLVAQGKQAFYATLQDVAREGFDNALDKADFARLKSWREGDGQAWFFIDSIDEAKLERIRFASAARKIADAIVGHEGRAHIVLSGRPTEWEFERDGATFAGVLPLPEPAAPPAPELHTLVRRFLNHEKAHPEPEKEGQLIVAMAPLDDAQVRQYAKSLEVENVDEFLKAIRTAHLEQIARRPLDLEWLVQYWITKGRIGRFEATVRQSLRERLKETDVDRRRYDRLVPETAMFGLERVGGAIVFARSNTIAIPDGEARANRAQEALDINEVLKDWPSDDRAALVNRAVFDPAAGRRMRLHNDNEGVVSGYLAACWLRRLREANLSGRALHHFLFAQTYGVDLIRPAMRETAAWLSIWDGETAREVVAREPALLFSAGDPESLALAVRADALHALVRRLLAGEVANTRDTAGLTRFAQPDLAPTLRQLWDAHSGNIEIKSLVLKLIWFGALRECADVAASAAFGPFEEKRTPYLAAQALMAAGDLGQRQAYVEHIKRNITSVPNDVLVGAIEILFPQVINVNDLLAFFEAGRLQEGDEGGTSLKWSAASLVECLTNPGDLERLIRGLLSLASASDRRERTLPGERDDTPEYVTAAAAERLLAISGLDTAPLTAVDAVLSFCVGFGAPRGNSIEKLPEAINRLHASPSRRRAAFWRAAQTLSAVVGVERPIETYLDMRHAGWNPGLQLTDLDWLLQDGPARTVLTEQQLAASEAMNLWAVHGKRQDVLARIEAITETCPAMRAEVDACLRPPVSSPEIQQHAREMEEHVAEHERQLTAQEEWWVAFVEGLRSAPDPVSVLLPGVHGEVNNSLCNLWTLLKEANRGKNHLAIDSVGPLAALAGDKVAQAFGQAASRVWRDRQPQPRSARPVSQRNMIAAWDPLALTGITLEAMKDPAWATRLSPAEAARATQYATLEINGLPTWIKDLANARPAEVQEILQTEVRYDLDTRAEPMPGQLLDYIERASQDVITLMGAPLWQEVVSRASLSASDLESLLSIARRALDADGLLHAYSIAIERFTASEDPAVAAQYLGFATSIDPHGATQALVNKLDTLEATTDKTALVVLVLPELFGSRMSFRPARAIDLDVATLLRLVIIANRAVRVEDDPDRANGKPYSPDGRDNAQDARGLAFNRLFETSGRETFDALMKLKTEPAFASRAQHMEALARERASLDSELPVWEGDAALVFEQRSEKEPTTGYELQQIALERLDDVQRDILHSDFAQGATVSLLPDEAAVQSWLADRLRLLQRRSYSVEREPETVAAKKPDIVLTARAEDAKVPLEIKVAESWSSRQLEEALRDQLCGQYLRARNHRNGILIVVHQTRPNREWHPVGEEPMKFPRLVEWLKGRAKQIRDSAGHGPQPEIAAIDVSIYAKEGDTRAAEQPPTRERAPSRKKRFRAAPGRRMSMKPSARRRGTVG